MLQRFALTLLALSLATCSDPPDWLDHVRASGELVVVTRNSPSTHYVGSSGEPTGPEFDLARGFAKHLGVTLTMHEVDTMDALFNAVDKHAAHMIAAGLAVTDKRRQRVNFSEPYQTVTQHVVYRLGTGKPRTVEDLFDRRLAVLAGSSHAEMLRRLKADHPRLTWREVDDMEIADLLAAVDAEDSDIDVTIADTTDFEINSNFLPELRIAFDLTPDDNIAWAFTNAHSQQLMTAANAYLVRIRRSGRLARILDRYYGHTDDLDYVGTRSFIRHVRSRLPRYQPWFEEAAAQHGVDWRLLAAVGYQESHWRPKAVSPTGVRGIMMLTEATADYLDIDNREDPRSSIFGAARFLARLKERLPDQIPEPDLTWMTLAAYNVGFYHLRDARGIVELDGGDPDAWIDVRKALPLLAQKKYYERLKYGYARGWEPVQYVENIRSYAAILRWMSAQDEAESASDEDEAVLTRKQDASTAAP